MCPKCYEYIKTKKEFCPKCGTKLRPKLDYVKRKRLKSKAWNAFSDYIKDRDCLATTGSLGRGVCYTCGKEFERKDLQAGHLKNGRTYSILFDEENVKIQCKTCNIFKNGMQGIFVLKRKTSYCRSKQRRIESIHR